MTQVVLPGLSERRLGYELLALVERYGHGYGYGSLDYGGEGCGCGWYSVLYGVGFGGLYGDGWSVGFWQPWSSCVRERYD